MGAPHYTQVLAALSERLPDQDTLRAAYFAIGQHGYMPGTKEQGYMAKAHLMPLNAPIKYDGFKGVKTESARITSDLYKGASTSSEAKYSSCSYG